MFSINEKSYAKDLMALSSGAQDRPSVHVPRASSIHLPMCQMQLRDLGRSHSFQFLFGVVLHQYSQSALSIYQAYDSTTNHTPNMAERFLKDRPEDTVANAEKYNHLTQQFLDEHLALSVKGQAMMLEPKNDSTTGENLLRNHKRKEVPSPYIKTLDIVNWVDKETLAMFPETKVAPSCRYDAPSCVFDAKRRRHADEEESDDDGHHAERVVVPACFNEGHSIEVQVPIKGHSVEPIGPEKSCASNKTN